MLSINNLCDTFKNMNMEDDYSDSEDQMETTDIYFGGVYIIWKNNKVIHCDYFIYNSNIANDEYQADRELIKRHREDFYKNRYSELNSKIDNIDTISFEIIESNLFTHNDDYYDIINVLKSVLQTWLNDLDYTTLKRKDPYNMTEMLGALKEIEDEMETNKKLFNIWKSYF